MSGGADDERALSRLVDLYARAVDRGDAALLAGLFTADATFDYGAMFTGGIDTFVPFVIGALAPMRTHHFMGNRLFVIEGDRAEGEVYSINSHVIPQAGGARDYVAGGRYLDRYRRTPDGWRIAHRTRVIDWTHERTLASGGPSTGSVEGRWLDADPSTHAFPLLAMLQPLD